MSFFKKLRRTEDEVPRGKKKDIGKLGSVVRLLDVNVVERHMVYRPGDVLTGDVVLELKKNVSNIRIRLAFLGEVKSKYGNTKSKRAEYFIERSTVLHGPAETQGHTRGHTQGEIQGESQGHSPMPINYEDLLEKGIELNGLTKGIHRFPFRIRVPHSKRMCSSIKFERGSIAYYLKAYFESLIDVTKPLAKKAFKVNIMMPIDVAKLPSPVPKSVVLVSNSKRHLAPSAMVGKHKTHALALNESVSNNSSNLHIANKTIVDPVETIQEDGDIGDFAFNHRSVLGSQDSSTENGSISRNEPRHSITSISSSSNSLLFKEKRQSTISSTSSTSNANVIQNHEQDSDVPATSVNITVNLSNTGYFGGEYIPVLINIKHYREYYHPTGIITTLVRICHVGTGKKDEPKETFRKDICQSISPLFIDSETLEEKVLTYLKVPVDAISTMTGLNRYFSFQYYVEVVVILSKKLDIYSHGEKPISEITESQKVKKTVLFPDSNTPSLSRKNSEMSTIVDEPLSKSGKFTGLDIPFDGLQEKMKGVLNTKAFFGLDNMNDINVVERAIIFDDMVDVERLKKMRNVVGLSIETIIGTQRSSSANKISKSSVTEVEDQMSINNTVSIGQSVEVRSTGAQYTDFDENHTNNFNNPGPVLNETTEFNDADINELIAPSNDYESYQPVPEYTPNPDMHSDEDKQEMEQRRLQALESEPPLM
ncbi:hypothetical protein RNJ44_01641 [Nakaseomyces bracarensis]|uniref:pH-response regulator protein palF/RIM8 n=1 Tax=Nakaseomyces bracarensis TaxID=273131 RepID=A0ABR4NNH2_9SACH